MNYNDPNFYASNGGNQQQEDPYAGGGYQNNGYQQSGYPANDGGYQPPVNNSMPRRQMDAPPMPEPGYNDAAGIPEDDIPF